MWWKSAVNPLLPPLLCGLPDALQRVCHAFPVLCPARALLARVRLGSCPSLHPLRRRLPGIVRRLLRYYGRIRLLAAVHHRLRLLAFPVRTNRGMPPWSATRPPGSRTKSVCTCQGLRPRRVVGELAIARPFVWPSAYRTASAPGISTFSWINGWPARSLSTLHVRPRDRTRMTRGRCGSLLLHRNGLAPSALCRSPGAPDPGRSRHHYRAAGVD